MKKKGFSLIELLVVIVVLVVIALITTPIILNVIEKAKKGALEDSAYGLIESANIYYAQKVIDDEKSFVSFVFENGKQTSEQQLSYRGKVENGGVKLFSEGQIELCITGNGYMAMKHAKDKKVVTTKNDGVCVYNEDTNEFEPIIPHPEKKGEYQTFDFTGSEQRFTVPYDGFYALEAWGAGNGTQGGGYTYTELELRAGDVLYVYVGGKANTFNGGGNGDTQYKGSGATDIRLVKASDQNWYDTSHTSWETDQSLLSRIVTAGGAGGAQFSHEDIGCTGKSRYKGGYCWSNGVSYSNNESAYARIYTPNFVGSFGSSVGNMAISYALSTTKEGKYISAAGGGGWYPGALQTATRSDTVTIKETYEVKEVRDRGITIQYAQAAYGGVNYIQGDNGNQDTNVDDYYTNDMLKTKKYPTYNSISKAGNESMPKNHNSKETMTGNLQNGFATISYIVNKS